MMYIPFFIIYIIVEILGNAIRKRYFDIWKLQWDCYNYMQICHVKIQENQSNSNKKCKEQFDK